MIIPNVIAGKVFRFSRQLLPQRFFAEKRIK